MCKKLTPASVIKRYDDCPPAFKISSVCKLALDGTGSPTRAWGSLPHAFNVKAVQGIRQTVHKAVFCISVKSDISYRSGRWRVWTKFSERVYNVCMQTVQSAAFEFGYIAHNLKKPEILRPLSSMVMSSAHTLAGDEVGLTEVIK